MSATLIPIRVDCKETAATCEDRDAIVFVHGIYGGEDTFFNKDTNFNWPEELPYSYRGQPVDVFFLKYQTELISWARGTNVKFKDLNATLYQVLKPLRMRQYRSIIFICHSLAGIVMASYIHYVKTKRGHPAASQNACLITLATPVLGAQVANIGSFLKSILGMSDQLLESLKKNNIFLEMLLEFRKAENEKRELYKCRPVSLHAAYEQEYLGPLLIVPRESADNPIVGLTSSPIVGFQLDHSEISKPTDRNHEVYRWVNQIIDKEFVRLELWSMMVFNQPKDRKLCLDIPFKRET